MEAKSKRLKLKKVDQYIDFQESFGWDLVSKSDLRPDDTVVITMQRNKDDIPRYSQVRALEKQYNRIVRPAPVGAIVTLVIGLGLLITFFLTQGKLFFFYAFLYGALTFFCVTVFLLVVYLIIVLNRGKILETIRTQAGIKSGANRDLPTARNIMPEEEGTWDLYEAEK